MTFIANPGESKSYIVILNSVFSVDYRRNTSQRNSGLLMLVYISCVFNSGVLQCQAARACFTETII